MLVSPEAPPHNPKVEGRSGRSVPVGIRCLVGGAPYTSVSLSCRCSRLDWWLRVAGIASGSIESGR